MAGWLGSVRIRRRSDFSKDFWEAALIFIATNCVVVPDSIAQSSRGHLSIDCGNTVGNYTDDNQLNWVAEDGRYIKTGNSSEHLFLESSIGKNQALRSYRFFPQRRNKHCYELPTSDPQEASYLIRASFYMNESVLKAARPFEFIISIDGTDWFTLKSGDDSQTSLFIVQEGIFYPPQEVMFFCLRPIIDVPFISSLEVRSLLKNTMYVYTSWKTQYLALIARYNTGANSTAPDVRYPHDYYDRIWKTPEASFGRASGDVLPRISSSESQDLLRSAASPNFVPWEVMQDAWLLKPKLMKGPASNSTSKVSFGVYTNGPQLQVNPAGQYMFVIVYAQDLNTTTSEFQNLLRLRVESLSTDLSNNLDLSDSSSEAVTPVNFSSSQVNTMTEPFFFTGSDYINISLEWCSVPSTSCRGDDRLPSINAVVIYNQYNYNFSKTNRADDQIITVLKTVFSMTDWQGDPCVPVPHDWLSCTLSLSQKFPKYYVTSINLSNSGISAITNTTTTPDIRLNSLNNMSITKSGVDDPTFQLLMNYASPILSSLNLSYNALTSLPATWENTTESLVVLDLSHNQLQGQISSLDNWLQRNSKSLRELG